MGFNSDFKGLTTVRFSRCKVLRVAYWVDSIVGQRLCQVCPQISEKQLLGSSCPSVRMEQLDSHWTDFHKKFDIPVFFFRKSVQKILVSLKSEKNNSGTVHGDLSTFVITH